MLLSCHLAFASLGRAEGPQVWHADLGGGWQSAIQLREPHDNGVRYGSFFWLTDERQVRWRPEDDGFRLVFRNPWNEIEENPPSYRFVRVGDGLKLEARGLVAAERDALESIRWVAGGPGPSELSSYSDKNSPYSRTHDRGRLTLDVTTVPVGLARFALRVFQDSADPYGAWLMHPGYSAEDFDEIYRDTGDSRLPNGTPSRRGSILTRLAMNPSVPNDLLQELWDEPSGQWAGLLPYLLGIHPNADPRWYGEVLERLSDVEGGESLRRSLVRHQPLPAEVVDLMIRTSTFQDGTPDSLAYRKDLSDAQVIELFERHPHAAGVTILERDAVPEAVFRLALDVEVNGGDTKFLVAILRRSDVPEAIAVEAIEAIMENPERHHYGGRDVGLIAVAGSGWIPEGRQLELAGHLSIEVRVALAGNEALSGAALEKLAEDAFVVVAAPVRERLALIGRADFLATLPAVDQLRTETGTWQAAKTALRGDAPEEFAPYCELLEAPIGHSVLAGVVEEGASKCVEERIRAGWWTRKQIASHAFSKGWNADLTRLILRGELDDEIVDQFALALAQRGEVSDLGNLTRVGARLEAATSPLVGWAVARRSPELVKGLLELGASPEIRWEGLTPAQLAVRMRIPEMLDLLPLDEVARRELEAFRKRFPGDPDAPWLGGWTNGKGEFKALNLILRADGTGTLFTAIGMGIPVAWQKRPGGESKFALYAFDEQGREQQPILPGRLEDGSLILVLGEREEAFRRSGEKPE